MLSIVKSQIEKDDFTTPCVFTFDGDNFTIRRVEIHEFLKMTCIMPQEIVYKSDSKYIIYTTDKENQIFVIKDNWNIF